jgi:hypothetical protein
VFGGSVEWRDLVATNVGAACGLIHSPLPGGDAVGELTDCSTINLADQQVSHSHR